MNKINIYLLNFLTDNVFVSLIHINLSLNSMLFIDLYLTLRNPFKPRESRVKWYFIFTTLMGLITIIPKTSDSLYITSYINKSLPFPLFFNKGLMFLPLSIPLILVTLIFVIKIIIQLCRKGSSNNLKKKILKRHFIYMFIFGI